MFAKALTLLAAAHTALAGVYITSPVATTNAVGGQVLSVAWADDGKAPSVSDIGIASVDLYTGSVNQQTFLQNLAASVDVSKASSISATIDESVGQSGPYYFVRFTAHDLKDSVNPKYPYQAFSAKFDIADMTGTFNSTILAQISGSAPTTAGPVETSAKSVKPSASASKSAGSLAASSTPTGGALGQYSVSAGMTLALAGIASYLVL